MCTELGQTGLNWLQPTKVDADVMHPAPGLESPMVTENHPTSFIFQTNANVSSRAQKFHYSTLPLYHQNSTDFYNVYFVLLKYYTVTLKERVAPSHEFLTLQVFNAYLSSFLEFNLKLGYIQFYVDQLN